MYDMQVTFNQSLSCVSNMACISLTSASNCDEFFFFFLLLSSLEALEEKLNTDCTSLMSLTGVGEGSYCVARFPLDSR